MSVNEARANLLKRAYQRIEEAKKRPHTKPWIQRCVASVTHGGQSKTVRAPKGLGREDVSRAFAICTAQYKKLVNKKSSDKGAFGGEEPKKESARKRQYRHLISKVRGK